MPTAPEVSDFPEELHPVIYLSFNNKPTNAILFLPGLGDTSENFAKFAKALNLPDAVTITLQPPFPLPFPVGPGFHWSDDLQVDSSSGEINEHSPLAKSSSSIAAVITDVLIKKHHFTPASVHLFGYGQGGSLALSVPLHESLAYTPSLGGVTSIGGPLPISLSHGRDTKSRTPVCLLGGRRGKLAQNDQSPVKRMKILFEFVEYAEWKKAEDSMPKKREEALPMMQFFARRLKSRRGVPDEFVEIG
jgi:predicted esterase